MKQKKGQDNPQHVNFNVSGNHQRQEGGEVYYHNQQQKSMQSQLDFIQYQNGGNAPLQNWNYWRGAANEGISNIVSSTQLSQPSIQDQQNTGAIKSGVIQGRKIDSSKQVHVISRSSLSMQPNVFYQGAQLPIQKNGFYNRESDLHSHIQQGQLYNQMQQINGSYEQSGNSSSSSVLKKKYSHSKEEPLVVMTNNWVNHTEGYTQNSQKKKRPASSLNQNQLKTIYEDIKRTERKPRSTSNTPQKENKSSRSASKKKSQERSSKKLSQTLDVNNMNNENQENEISSNMNPSDKQLQGTVTLRRKKKSSNSVHIKPVSKQNQQQQPQQHSASKSRSPGRVKKNSLHSGAQPINGNILGEKNFNSPLKTTKVLTSNKSPDDKQKKKKKTSLSKSKSKPKLSHAKSTSQLLVSQQQQQSLQQMSHQQSISNDYQKNHTLSTNNFKDVESFIKRNAQKIQFEQFAKKQEEIEERIKTKQEDEKRKIQNEQIRKENLVKFCKFKKAQKEEHSQMQQNIHLNTLQLQQKYAWGTNQQRIKMHQIIQSQQQFQQQSIEKSQFNYTQLFPKGQLFNSEEEMLHLQQEKEKKRREQSGLSFLNHLNESLIKKKLEYERIKQETISKNDIFDDNKSNLNEDKDSYFNLFVQTEKLQAPLNHEEIKKFMVLKKKRIESEHKKRQDEQKERQERLKNNLQVLDQEIKNSRQNNSCWVQGNVEKDKMQMLNGAPTHQRSKSAQRKKKSRTVSTPNLEKFFNKTQSQGNGNGFGESLLKKELSHKQFIINQNQNDPQFQNGSLEEKEEEFLQNNYFSNTQQQYSKKYEPIGFVQNKFSNNQTSTNNHIIGQTTDANEENFDMLNKEFKKMFNITGSYIDDKNLMEFSQSINKTWQLTTQGQNNTGSNRLGSSGKKKQSKQTDYAKPKSISMHASSSVGNFKIGQGFDSSHFGNLQNVQPQPHQKIKESSKERNGSNTNNKKSTKSHATSISPEPKVLTKSHSTHLKNIPQQFTTIDNLYKKLQQAQKLDVSDQVSQTAKDKYIQELVNQKRDELKNMYNKINSRMTQIKHQVNPNEQNYKPGHSNEGVNLEEKEDQTNYEQKYYNQPLNNKRIQQAIQQQQQGNSNSLGSVNSSQRRVHISNASPIKEEPEEEDRGHFSNNPLKPNAKLGQNYVNSFQQIFQNNKKDVINSESSNQTNNNYPHKINSNPNESDSNRNIQLKDIQQNNFKKIKDNVIESNPLQINKMPSPIQQIQVNIPINPIPSLSKVSPPSQNSRLTPSASLSMGTDQKKNDLQRKQGQEQNNLIITPAVNKEQEYHIPQESNFNISAQHYQNNQDNQNRDESSINPADPNAPLSLNFKETIQSKSYLSSRNDQRNSLVNQGGQEGEQIYSDIENGMITSKELQPQQDNEMPILPLNLNFQYRVQQMKKRTHNTDNDEISQDSSSRNLQPQQQGVVSTNTQIIQQQQGGNIQRQPIQPEGLVVSVTSKTPQSTNRDENNRSSNQNAERDYQQFQKEEEIRLDLIKEIETQNQMSSCNFESQVFQQAVMNTNPSNLPSDLIKQKQPKAPQHTPIENLQGSHESEEGEEIDVDYLYDLDYDQLQELKMIIFQSDPENPEIQALSEQLILYDAAATIIQKVFRGFYTRKCIAAIIEYQRQQDEEEELMYQQAEKFLEENQIEPEELLEGNPMPFAIQQQQNNLPYHPSDQLKEYENREMQLNKNPSTTNPQYSKNEISESDFPIKIKDYQNNNQGEGNNTFNRESQGDHPFLTSLSMPEQSANKDLYHQKNYNDDLLQPKQSDFVPDFDFYDQPSEKSKKNTAEIYNQNVGLTTNNYPNSIPTFLPQHAQNILNDPNKQQTGIQNTANQQQKAKFINSNNGHSENYREQNYNQLNLQEINEQSKSLVTVKDFDTSSKDKNRAVADSIFSNNNQANSKNLLSPQSESHLQIEITKLQEQAKIWNEMISQIVQLPENQSQQFKDNALKILSNLQKQSEMSKQLLIDNIKLNAQIPKSPLLSTDRFPLSELDNMNDKQNQSNGDSSSKDQISSTSANALPIKLSQTSQFNNQNKIQQQVDDKKSQVQVGSTQKKNLQLDIEEIESNYNRQQRKEQVPKVGSEFNANNAQQPIELKEKEEEKRRNSDNDMISQEQRAMVRALSVSSVESNELRYANIVSNNSYGPSNKVSKAKQNFLDRLNNDQILNTHSNKNSHVGNESVSSVGSSFFDKQPFKEFTSKILQKYTMPQESVEELIKTREEAIEYKHKTQMDLIQKMHERNRISPKSFERKQFELEKWVSKERENLKDVKREIERGWEQFAQTIKQTKRDIEFMEQTKRIDTSKLLQSSEEDQLRRLLSMRSESEHSIEEIGLVERRSIEGIYQFRNNVQEDPNKIKIVDTYKPADHSTLSNHSSTNIRNRNNSDNTSQPLSSRSRQLSQPNNSKDDFTKEKDQMTDVLENNFSKYNPRYLNVGLQLQLAQENQQVIQKQQQQKQQEQVSVDIDQAFDQSDDKLAATLDRQARKISSNGSSVHDGEEEIDQFLTAEKNKNEGNIHISQRRAFDAYGYSSDDLCDEDDFNNSNNQYHRRQNNSQNDNLEIYIDQESENIDRLDVSPIFTVSSASKQGTQDKESLKFLMGNNSTSKEAAPTMKMESDTKHDKVKQGNKRNSQDSRMSESQPSSPLSESSRKNQDPFQTNEYDDDSVSKKQTKSNKASPRIGFMRGDMLQEEGIDHKINYISDQTLNYLVDDAAKGTNIKAINDKKEQQNQQDNSGASPNMIQINFMEPIKARQNVYNLDDFPDVSDRTSSLETSSGIYKAITPQIQQINSKNAIQQQEEDQFLKQNNNKQKNPIPSPQNSPTSKENLGSIASFAGPKSLQNNFLLDLINNDKKDSVQEDKQAATQQQNSLQSMPSNEEDKQEKMTTEELYNTQNSQQQLQFSEQILSTQNNLPGLECATLNFIKDYLVAFSEFIKDNFTDEFLDRVNIPLGMDPQEFLKTFTITETVDNSLGEISAAPIYPIVKYIHMQRPVVSEELFAHFNEIFNRERDLSVMTEELFELERYHMRMIFDCFNEALDSMRPFGLRGKPLPWKINSNKLSSIMITPDNIEKILGLAIAKVLKWGSFLCGFIPERIESPTGEIVQIEDDYLNQIKEDRLAQMLENEVIENEDKWLTYEDEETDVQLEIADDIFNFLIEEAAMLMHGLQNGGGVDQKQIESQNDIADNENVDRNFGTNYEGLSKNIFGNPNISKTNKKQGLGGGIRPTNDLGISQQQAQEKKQLQKEMFLKNLQSGKLLNNQAQKDALNSSF